MRRRQSVVPYLVLFGIATWGTWWYGSKQATGLARQAADRIGIYAGAARDMVNGYIERAPDKAPEVVLPAEPTPAPVVKKPSARKRSADTTTKATADSSAAAAVAAPDTTKVKTDSLR